MDSRRWHRLHMATWLVLLAVGGVLIYVQYFQTVEHYYRNTHGYRGWPLPFFHPASSGPVAGFTLLFPATFNVLALLGDVLVTVCLLASTAFVIERWLRQPRRLQFQLGTLLWATVVAAALLLVPRYVPRPPQWVFSWNPSRVNWKPTLMAAPLMFSIACAIDSAAWLVVRLGVRAWRLVSPTGNE